MGEIGGNDYNYAFFAGGTISRLRKIVPFVVEAITATTSVSSCSCSNIYCYSLSSLFEQKYINNDVN